MRIASLLALLLVPAASAQIKTRLAAETDAAFNAYVKHAESGMDWHPHLKPSPDGSLMFAPGSGDGTAETEGGLIHDWVAAAYAPGVTIAKVLALFQDYAAYKVHYSPNVRESALLAHDGNHWRVYLQLYKKKIFSVLLDTEYDIEYRPLGGDRWAVLAPSTKVVEVDDGKQLPQGTGYGFLWRLNSYWILEPRPNGVYLECRAISLSRDVPVGLGWAVKPMLTAVPRESLGETLDSTLRALR